MASNASCAWSNTLTDATPQIHGPHPELLAALQQIFAPEQLATDPAERWAYGYDNSRQHRQPGLVVRPDDETQVAALLRLCQQHKVPLVARGSGTGTTGASVPATDGVVLSLERMNKILEVDPENRLLRAQTGVTNQALQQAASAHGFFWPPDPTSAAVCTLGGNLACNAAGPRAVKYGTPRDNTLGLRAVTASGEVIRCGVRTTKGVVGYDLTRLLIGSEGTLAVITEATLKLTPKPEAVRTLRALYTDVRGAAEAVSRIMAQPVTPCALEFMDAQAIAMIRDYSNADLPADAGALLMIEVDGPSAGLDAAVAQVAAAAHGPGCMEVMVAHDASQVQALWETRKALSPALRTVAPKKINEDVVVPVSQIPALVDGLGTLSRRHGITIVNFGHAGNGNLHVNLLVDPHDPRQMAEADACLAEVFELVLRLGGTLSGEHGIGLVKRPYVAQELDPDSLTLMHGIKRLFDPNGILNPGKTLP